MKKNHADNIKTEVMEKAKILSRDEELIQETSEIIDDMLKHILKTHSERVEQIMLYKSLQELKKGGEVSIMYIQNILESLSVAKAYSQCTEPVIFDYDDIVAYISEKDKQEQVRIVVILTKYFSQYYIWETNNYHCLTKLEQRIDGF